MRRGTIDLRLRRATWIVLASAGCGASSEGRPPAEAVPTATARLTPPAPAVTTTPRDNPLAFGGPIEGGTNTASPPPPPRAQSCAEYAARTRISPDSVTARYPGRAPRGGRITVRRDASGELCEVIHHSVATTVEQMIAHRCCPPMTQPCPPPSVQKVQGHRHLVERVLVLNDGTTQRQALGWVDVAPEPPIMPACGRRPEGFALDPTGDDDARLLAAMAELEAASVVAFDRLARELAHHGAPPALVRGALRAREDETRHARVLAKLAVAAGARPREVGDDELPCRELEAVARENATEGCVFETFGALVASFQAASANGPSLRRVFEHIAADERRHAVLAARVHDWARSRLAREARTRLDDARQAAITTLRRGLADGRTRRHERLGLPSREEAMGLVDAYFAGG